MGRLKVILVAGLAVALYAAATVSPAGGGISAARGTPCVPAMAGDGLFSVYAKLTPAAYGRGFQQREPLTSGVASDLPASAKGKAGPNFRATVPVYFHVVTDGSIGNLTGAQISAQMTVLNQNFVGSNTGFRFTLAGVTRTDNAAWFYAGPGGTDEHSMKHALHQGGLNALNLYSTTAGPYLGWAYLPDIVTKPGQAYLDGIVIDWESMPGTSTTYAGRYDEGKTATHEAGHWLNLEHTFYKGCTETGDFVADTPPQKTPTSGCPEGKDTCPEPGLDPIHNYMDYSFDSCYTEFTPGQAQRMKDAWLFFRAGG
jgi:Pregnancy-associated plasma protein-A